jgi:ribosomal subunit interface protein
MEIRFVSRHNKASPSLQEAITADLQKLERFSDKITAEITMHVFNREIVAFGKAENIGKAFNSALEKIERQLIKTNEKIKDHKHA